jgi:hypothetical protein
MREIHFDLSRVILIVLTTNGPSQKEGRQSGKHKASLPSFGWNRSQSYFSETAAENFFAFDLIEICRKHLFSVSA